MEFGSMAGIYLSDIFVLFLFVCRGFCTRIQISYVRTKRGGGRLESARERTLTLLASQRIQDLCVLGRNLVHAPTLRDMQVLQLADFIEIVPRHLQVRPFVAIST